MWLAHTQARGRQRKLWKRDNDNIEPLSTFSCVDSAHFFVIIINPYEPVYSYIVLHVFREFCQNDNCSHCCASDAMLCTDNECKREYVRIIVLINEWDIQSLIKGTRNKPNTIALRLKSMPLSEMWTVVACTHDVVMKMNVCDSE